MKSKDRFLGLSVNQCRTSPPGDDGGPENGVNRAMAARRVVSGPNPAANLVGTCRNQRNLEEVVNADGE